ncbi:21131_t:CDS:2 [Racocetra persica]|uniref:21131_t:CDS:1 n=1 Tax=Racocetra persica TaxID=160502 RepID=A0ACA9NH43_9GLOM|nr:21131_t:CDS:2 [Racocetra persica]
MAGRLSLRNFVKIFISSNSIKSKRPKQPARLQTSPISRVLRKRDIILNKKMPKTKLGYYAVRIGHKPGIYKTWEECRVQVHKYPNAKYEKFPTLKEAQAFMSGVSNSEKDPELDVADNSYDAEVPKLVVWTDGCALNNGKEGARAGLGVFWGDNDTRNLSERLPGYKQTNNRAEIMAVIRALETCPDPELPLEIMTDSKYTINAYESWIPKWIKSGWKTANNKPVENKDLFVHLVELIEARPGKVFFTHVPGHVGIPGNEAADRLANLGALKEEVETTTVSSAEKISQNSIMNFTEDDFYSPEELTEIAAEVYSLRR